MADQACGAAIYFHGSAQLWVFILTTSNLQQLYLNGIMQKMFLELYCLHQILI